MAWSDLQLPEDQLAAMLAVCQPWRGICAYPTYKWADLAAVLDAGTLEAGDAVAKVATSRLADDPEDEHWIDYPRAAVSHTEGDDYSRVSVSTHDLAGRLFLMVEMELPPDLLNRKDGADKDDVRRKAVALMAALMSVPRQHPYLDITGVSVESGVVFPNTNNGVPLGVIQATVTYAGSVP